MIQIPRSETHYPILLQWKDKHSTTHYLVQDKEGLLKALFSIVKDWKSQGYFYAPSKPEESDKDKEYAALTTEVLKTLPKDILTTILERRKSFQRKMSYYESALEDYNLVTTFLESGDPEMTVPFERRDGTIVNRYVVLDLINNYSDGEYQSVREVDRLIVF